jgi:outer membrane protein assembly factor BamB
LRAQVRDLDSLARQAYLESLSFRRRGAWLLLATLLVMLGSLKLMSGTAKGIPAPATRNDDNQDVRAMAGAAILGFLVFLGGIVYVFAHERRPQVGLAALPARNTGARVPAVVPPAAVPAAKPAGDEKAAESFWPAFRGWRGVGLGAKQQPPVGWDGPTGSNIIWKTKVPLPGYNSPVVWDQQIFISGADKTRRAVYSFNARTGALLWEVAVNVPDVPDEVPEVSDDTGYAASTMACDNRHAYAIFANGDLICVDHAGHVVWSRNLGLPKIMYGYASSLLAHEGRLFVQRDIGGESALLAFDGATGMELWRDGRDEISAWSSPIMAMLQDEPVLVVNGPGLMVAYAPATGVRLWSSEGLTGEIAPSPASADGLVLAAMSGAGCLALKLEDGAKVWEKTDLDVPEITSPVMAEGRAFVLSDNGALTCLQATTGAILWQHEFDATFNASPVILAGRLYLTDITGRTQVIQASGTFEPVATARLGEACYATPAAAGTRLYLRGREHLFCVGDATP